MSVNDTQVGGDHYKKGGSSQHWDLITDVFGPSYLVGNATKYVTRWRDKNGKEDLKKALHYVQKLIEVVEKDEGMPMPTPRPVEVNVMLSEFITANQLPAKEARIVTTLMTATSIFDYDRAELMIRDLSNE